MRIQSGDLTFIAVLVTAILLIFVANVDAIAVKVVADLIMTYWTARLSWPRTPESLRRTSTEGKRRRKKA